LYCPLGDFYIDPHRGVDTAVVTHAHSDHARRGSRRYFCESSSIGLLKSRLGKNIQVEGIPYREILRLGEVDVSLHSAGHILGSAQVRIQCGKEVWVASGDYKRDPDPSCEPFEPVSCDVFITEATFGTPKYKWNKESQHGLEIYQWWQKNAAQGMNSVLFGYSLGKAQRILAELAPFACRPVLVHETISELTRCYREEGRRLAETLELDSFEGLFRGELILVPPSALEKYRDRLRPYKTAFASGWMQNGRTGGFGQSGGYDHGFVLSDHADWIDLNRTIDESGAKQVFVQHRNGALIQHLRRRGIDAHPIDSLTPEGYERIGGVELRLL
jgi:putative mRNA 3-end processing factor